MLTIGAISMIEPILDQYLAPILRMHDFRRKGRLWNRQLNAISHVVFVQSGRWNDGTSGHFTANLGVFLPAAYQAIWGKLPPKWARDVDCTIIVRIGQVMEDGTLAVNAQRGKGRDFWWKFDATTDIEQLGRQIANVMVQHGLPFLEQFDSLAAIYDFLCSHPKEPMTGEPHTVLSLAVLKFQLGDEEGSRQLLQSASERFPAWRERAQSIALHLGLVSNTKPNQGSQDVTD